MSDVIR